MRKSILLSSFFILASFCFGQTYERIYSEGSEEIKSKIDLNKVSGIPILTGIQAEHRIGFSMLNEEQKIKLAEMLTQNTSVLSYELAEDFTSIKIVSSASFTNAEIDVILTEISIFKIGLTSTYSLNN